MDKPEDFMKAVILNLRKANIDLETNDIISSVNLRRGIKTYFGYTTQESVIKMSKILSKRGFIELNALGFRITSLSKTLISQNKD